MDRTCLPLVLACCALIALTLAPAASGEALAVGQAAPALGITKAYNVPAGKKFDLADFRGKVVLVDFWATWCGPCVAAIPHVEATWNKYKTRGLVVLGHTDASSENLEAFIKSNKITYPITVGANIGDGYGVRGIPHLYLIDHAGKVLWHGHPSQLEDATIEQALAKVPAKR